MEKQRTPKQNAALHKYFNDVALALLEQGIERKTVVNDLEGYSCPIDATFMKEVWRSIQFTQTGKLSTTELTTSEIDKVYDTFNRFMSEEYGVSNSFPSVESMYLAYLEANGK